MAGLEVHVPLTNRDELVETIAYALLRHAAELARTHHGRVRIDANLAFAIAEIVVDVVGRPTCRSLSD